MIATKTDREAKGRALVLGLFLLAAFVAACLLPAAKYAHAIDLTGLYTVNSTGDEPDASVGNDGCATSGGVCTLRAAIQEANHTTTGDDIVDFDIPSTDPNCNANTGVCTISPTSSLPVITEPLSINGYSQPGASANTQAVGNDAVLRIRLDGSDAGIESAGLNIAAHDSVVRGLSVTGFSSGAGIIVSGDNNIVEGNFIGTDPSGIQTGLGNAYGVLLKDDFPDPYFNPIHNTVGGTTPGARNIISGNIVGITIFGGDAGGNKVEGNYIGTSRSGTGELGNGANGVQLRGGSNNTIGGIGAARNTIAFNGTEGPFSGSAGVAIYSDPGDPVTGNRILSNSIFSNGGLGIDLVGGSEDPGGRTANDGVGDTDTGANNLQNFPLISSARTFSTATTVRGTLESTPNGTFALQFFSSPKDTRDEGKKFIGERVVVDGNGDGIMPFTFKPSSKVRVGMFVTATATYDSTGDTSEFSVPKKVRE